MKSTKQSVLLVILVLLMLAAVGCSNFGYQDGKVSMDIKLGADNLNKLVARASEGENSFIGKDNKIELVEPNLMRISGDFHLGEGQRASGTVDFAITSTENGANIQIVESNVPGLDVDGPVVNTFNKALGGALSEAASTKNDGAGITGIQVKDGKLVISVTMKVK